MIDRLLLPVQRLVMTKPARLLASRGVGADQVTLAGLGVGVLCFAALGLGWTTLGLILLVLNRLLDGLDGAVARLTLPSDRGAFMDIAADFLFYALVPLGFAFANPAANALPAAALIAAFVGTGASFMAFAVIAAKRGMAADAYPAKGIYYLGGLTEGAETIGFFLAMCLWPGAFAELSWVFVCLCLVTTVLRLRMGWVAFETQ